MGITRHQKALKIQHEWEAENFDELIIMLDKRIDELIKEYELIDAKHAIKNHCNNCAVCHNKNIAIIRHTRLMLKND